MLNFVGIGAQKGGTTWVAENLAKHPSVAFPAGKEIHFWDWHYANGVEWYQNLFQNDELINGDITPAYAFMDVAKIKELKSIAPDVPLIYSVRNPMDRAWSAARMMVKRAELTMDEASDAWFIDHFKSAGSRNRGDYIRAVDNWLSVFDESQLLLTNFDDITTRPHALMQTVAEHIGIDSAFFAPEAGNVTLEKVHKSVGSSNIRPSLVPVLEDIYGEQMAAMKKHPILKAVYGD
jgi:hypothetical protein